MSQKYTVTLPCKPYVKRFVELNYGSPAEISDRILYDDLRGKLEKKSTRYDSRYKDFKKYTESIQIRIFSDDFYRNGWELTHTNIVSFNRTLEGRAKIFLYTMVGTRVSMGMNMTDAIDIFMKKYGFDDKTWPAESIYRDCIRNLTVEKNECLLNISETIDKICLDRLSINGTISRNINKL